MSWKIAMPSKIILGVEPWLSMAVDDWRLVKPETDLIPIEIKLDENFLFDLTLLNNYLSEDVTGFVAWGPEFLNFQRLELVGALKKKGFKLPALIHPSAQVSVLARYQENVWIQALCYVGPNSSLEFNCCICVGSKIGANAIVNKSAWIGQSSTIKHGAVVGAHSVLGDGVQVSSHVIVGRQVRIDTACIVDRNVAEKTFRILNNDLQGVIVKL
jgi:acetyltransferase-like isoleucine patch superfamily enzyme